MDALMVDIAPQLTLGLHLKDEATFANFYAGNNAEAIVALKAAAAGMGEKIIYLCNAGGFGCSHLLQAACHEAHLHQLVSVYLPLSNHAFFSPEILQGFESLALICIDDI